MKQARNILGAIVVFAVIGGVLAFKARTAHTWYREAADGNCTSAFQTTLTTLTLPGDVVFITRYSTRPVIGPCPIRTVKVTL